MDILPEETPCMSISVTGLLDLLIVKGRLIDVQPTRLPTGLEAPFGLAIRGLRSHPDILGLSAQYILQHTKRRCENWSSISYLANVSEPAGPLTTVMSVRENIPMITPKSGRTRNELGEIIGHYQAGGEVLLVDWLTGPLGPLPQSWRTNPTNDRRVAAIKTLQAHGLQVVGLCGLVEPQPHGDKLTREICPSYVLFDLRAIIVRATQLEQIQPVDWPAVDRFLTNPVAYNENSSILDADIRRASLRTTFYGEGYI